MHTLHTRGLVCTSVETIHRKNITLPLPQRKMGSMSGTKYPTELSSYWWRLRTGMCSCLICWYSLETQQWSLFTYSSLFHFLEREREREREASPPSPPHCGLAFISAGSTWSHLGDNPNGETGFGARCGFELWRRPMPVPVCGTPALPSVSHSDWSAHFLTLFHIWKKRENYCLYIRVELGFSLQPISDWAREISAKARSKRVRFCPVLGLRLIKLPGSFAAGRQSFLPSSPRQTDFSGLLWSGLRSVTSSVWNMPPEHNCMEVKLKHVWFNWHCKRGLYKKEWRLSDSSLLLPSSLGSLNIVIWIIPMGSYRSDIRI